MAEHHLREMSVLTVQILQACSQTIFVDFQDSCFLDVCMRYCDLDVLKSASLRYLKIPNDRDVLPRWYVSSQPNQFKTRPSALRMSDPVRESQNSQLFEVLKGTKAKKGK